MKNDTVSVEVLEIKKIISPKKPNLVANASIRLKIFEISQKIGGFSIWKNGNDIGITPLKIGMVSMYYAEDKALWQKITHAIKTSYLLEIQKIKLENSFSTKKN